MTDHIARTKQGQLNQSRYWRIGRAKKSQKKLQSGRQLFWSTTTLISVNICQYLSIFSLTGESDSTIQQSPPIATSFVVDFRLQQTYSQLPLSIFFYYSIPLVIDFFSNRQTSLFPWSLLQAGSAVSGKNYRRTHCWLHTAFQNLSQLNCCEGPNTFNTFNTTAKSS